MCFQKIDTQWLVLTPPHLLALLVICLIQASGGVGEDLKLSVSLGLSQALRQGWGKGTLPLYLL